MHLRVTRTKALATTYVALAIADAALAGMPGSKARRLRSLTKPALMPALIAASATRHPSPRASTSNAADRRLAGGIRAAQVMSWGGDVALLGRSERAFLTGLGSFLGAHGAYVASFLSRRGQLGDVDPRPLGAAAVVWLTTVPVMTVAAGRRGRRLAAPVAAYGTALVGMVAAAGVLDPTLSQHGRRMVQAGAALFLVSDTLLGSRMFLVEDDHPALDVAVMVSYTAGQGLIAAGAAAL